jgi:cystathionine beta-lyase
MPNHQQQQKTTQLIHQPITAPEGFSAVQPPVYRASTVFFASTQAMRQHNWQDDYDYSYGLHGTPTTYILADKIAQLEGGTYCTLAPSGLSAISIVNFSFLKQGDEVWLPANVYAPNKQLIQQMVDQFGIVYQLYNPVDVASFQPTPATALIWLEAAGSVTLEFPDLCGLVQKAKAAKVLTVLDNTWGAGLAFCPFDFSDQHLSVDISVHALTKYPSGGADILMGSIVTRDQKLHLAIKRTHALHGVGIAGDDTERVIRSLPSLPLRYDAQDQSTRQLAQWLQQQPHFSHVLHPTLVTNEGHTFWQQVCDDRAAGLVSVVFDAAYTQAQVDQFCDTLQLFKLGYSWGGPMSLVMPYALQQVRVSDTSHLASGLLVRFCIGLEDSSDLIADIAQALDSTFTNSP